MKYFKEVQKFLAGKKTYIVSAITIGLGFYLDNTELIMLGLMGLTGRAGLRKVESKLEEDLGK